MTIVSGGQTGADRAALDFAIRHGIPHGGWCPRGRRAVDGQLPACYQLRETPSEDYLQRTEWNVRDSDATWVFSLEEELTGGSKDTVAFAEKLRRPWLHFHPGNWSCHPGPGVRFMRAFAGRYGDGFRLNVAGPREAADGPSVYQWTFNCLKVAFGKDEIED
jgi:hypothetical protein